jgi:hypothetical protein
MTKAELYAHPGWEWCTAEGARRHLLVQGLRSTFREKLEWLEEAETLTLQLRKSREQAGRNANIEPSQSAPASPADQLNP